jgi:hypothetical protein
MTLYVYNEARREKGKEVRGERKWGFLRRRGKGAEPLPRKYRFAKPGGRTRGETSRPRPGQASVRALKTKRRWRHGF